MQAAIRLALVLVSLLVKVKIAAIAYDVDSELAYCIVRHESDWDPNAVGDDGEAVGLWQWHKESIKIAMRVMNREWDWQTQGDPRLNVKVSSAAACYALSRGWNWWSTQRLCGRR